jgi:peptide/nickel transport system substrate-binding protein
VLLAVTACGGGGADKADKVSSAGMIASLNLTSDAPATVGGLVNYNPHSPNSLTKEWLYETLLIRNRQTCEVTPWLATKSTWTGADHLSFDIREGVKWSDGKPFTAKDVAFTLNLGKKYPAIDTAGLWNNVFGAPAKSVTAEGNKVNIVFAGNSAPKFDNIINTKILPEHIWSKVGDPAKYIDKKPVGTGPFAVGSYNGRRLVLTRRADYWQADKVKVKQLVLEGQYDAAKASLALRGGQLDMFQGEIPNPARTFVSANPKINHFYYPPTGATVLSFNLEQKPFSDVKFREATAFAIDRAEVSKKATYGIMKPASQSGLRLPAAKKYLPSTYSPESTVIPFDAAKANALLDAAGYKKGPDGKRTNIDGSPLSLVFTAQAGWIDYLTMADVVVRGFNAVGLNTKVVATAPESVDAQKKSGRFEMMFEYIDGGCELAKNLGAKLASNQIPTKTAILPNVERWNDKESDKQVAGLIGSIDEAEQLKYAGQLVTTMMTQYPITALIYAPTRLLYRTDKAVGWPSDQNPYAHPDNKLLILTHLTPAP